MFSQYFRGLWAFRFVLVGAACVCGLIGLTYALLRPAAIKATATANLADASWTASQAIAALSDREVVTEVLTQLPSTVDHPSAAEFVRDHLEVVPIPGTRLLRVIVTMPDAHAAVLAVEALIKRAGVQQHARASEQLAAAKHRMTTAAARVEAFARALENEFTPSAEVEYDALKKVHLDLAEAAYLLELSSTKSSFLEIVAVAPAQPASQSAPQLFLMSFAVGLLASTLIAAFVVYSRSVWPANRADAAY